MHSTHWLIYAQALKPPLRDPTAAQQSKYWGVTWARKQSKQFVSVSHLLDGVGMVYTQVARDL